ncbi:gamma-tubulin complex component 6 [Cimex lectularius]|uniref:Gamma tubulin complex component C-terminal domain-containing protein n=1 Tax=Cimex lectularius TaxID=79782 RepID=A0A8I6RLA4_CIMLE|nr:gamma-tubulin complex component 6 [Cimex lectularius]
MESEKDDVDLLDQYHHLGVPSLLGLLSKIFATDSAGVDTYLEKELKRTAWEMLLKKRFIESTNVDEILRSDVFSAVMWFVHDECDRKDEITEIIYNLEMFFQEHNQHWVEDAIKVLLMVHLLGRRQKVKIERHSKEIFKEHVDNWVKKVEQNARPPQELFPHKPRYFTFNPCSISESIQNQIRQPLSGLLKESRSWPADDDFSSLSDIASCSSQSNYILDEGFVTPGDDVEVSENTIPEQTYRDISEEEKSDFVPFTDVNLCDIPITRDKGKWTPFRTVYPIEPPFFSLDIHSIHQQKQDHLIFIPRNELINDLKVLLLGVASNSFYKENDQFFLKKNLYTNGLSPNVLIEACREFIKTGENYLALEGICKELVKSPSPILTAIKPCIDKYRYKYQTVISTFSHTESILLFQKYVQPLAKQVNFLVSCLRPLPDGIEFLGHLYNCLSKMSTSSSVFHLAAILFYSSCESYFSVLDKWIFYGQCHPDLFIKQNYMPHEITSRDSLLKAYTYIPEKAPCFLPSDKIYFCGLYLIVLHLCATDNYLTFDNIKRPQITLCANYKSFKLLEEEWLQYYEKWSSMQPTTCGWLDDYDIDLSEVGEQREIQANKILSDMKLVRQGFFQKKRLEELNLQREILHSELETAFIKFKDHINTDRKLKEQFYEEEQKRINLQETQRIKLCHHYKTLMSASDKANDHFDWVTKREILSGKRMQLLMEEEPLSVKKNETESQCSQENMTNNTPNSPEVTVASDQASVLPDDLVMVDVTVEPSSAPTENSENEKSSSLPNESASLVNDCVKIDDQIKNISDNFNQTECILPQNTSANGTEHETSSELESKVTDTTSSFNRKYSYSDNFRNKFCSVKVDDIMSKKELKDEFDKTQIDSIISKSISLPLRIQTKLINESLLYVFCIKNKLLYHILALRKYFFLYDGVYGEKLCNALFNAINKKEPAELLTFTNLGNILQDACGDNVKELTFLVSDTPPGFDLTNPQVLSCLNLSYKADWPLNLILTEKTIIKYDTVFSFVMAIEQAAWYLKKLFFLLRVKYVDVANSLQYKQIQLHRHVMSQFISAFKCYLAVVVFESSWRNLAKVLSTVNSCEELYRAHINYLKDVRFKCFLNQSASNTLVHLMKLLQCILMYCRVYEFGEIDIASSGEFFHSKFSKLNHTFQNFMSLAKYFIYIIQSYAQNKQQNHFEILLEFLHNNSFSTSYDVKTKY